MRVCSELMDGVLVFVLIFDSEEEEEGSSITDRSLLEKNYLSIEESYEE